MRSMFINDQSKEKEKHFSNFCVFQKKLLKHNFIPIERNFFVSDWIKISNAVKTAFRDKRHDDKQR